MEKTRLDSEEKRERTDRSRKLKFSLSKKVTLWFQMEKLTNIRMEKRRTLMRSIAAPLNEHPKLQLSWVGEGHDSWKSS
ncbi:unnamed protein product [Linum trigynum]|uniref:Uncharacterized protein n=1 Tax=Linum trigynum TaxID=586398 RepID=A0AAV2DMC0_9ROSI